MTEEQKALITEEVKKITGMGIIFESWTPQVPNIFYCERCEFEFLFSTVVQVSYAQCPKCYAFLSKNRLKGK